MADVSCPLRLRAATIALLLHASSAAMRAYVTTAQALDGQPPLASLLESWCVSRCLVAAFLRA